MIFKEELAEVYDKIYSDKDYALECNFIEEIFKKYSKSPVKTILDVGCGSGSHAILLSERGYTVVGFDSSGMMIAQAKKKSEKIENLDFHVMDMRDFQLGSRFDACVCMFAVIGYLTETHEVQKTLANIRKHLKDGSLFISDFWNGLAVLRILPSVRTKILKVGERRVIRIGEPQLDAFNHVCKVKYRFIITEKNTIVDEAEEMHAVRFFFPQEMAHYLEDAGFEVLKICPFMNLNGRVDENVWNIAVIARAI